MASASVTVRDDDEPTEPGQTVGFAYVAYDLTGLNGNELATRRGSRGGSHGDAAHTVCRSGGAGRRRGERP